MAGEIETLIENVVHDQFSPGSVQRVIVENAHDEDGDAIFRVTVVTSRPFSTSDERKMLGLARHIRVALDNQNQDAFPMIDFISQADAAKRKFEIA